MSAWDSETDELLAMLAVDAIGALGEAKGVELLLTV